MGELINGRTPEEIKRGILCSNGCCDCPYAGCISEDETCSEYVERDTLALIERLESERDAALAKVPRWISVEERLPEKRGTYLCNYMFEESGRIVMSCDYLGDKGWSFMTADVTHWMPMLPEPPKEETT